MPGRVIITVSNDIVTDQRVKRMSNILRDYAYQVTIVGRLLKSDLDPEKYGHKLRRFRMIFKKGPLFYIFLNIRHFFYLLRHKSDIIISVDLDTLLAGVLANKFKTSLLIYDAHEYFTGVPELLNRPRVRSVWKRVENYALPKAGAMITVNESIAYLYREEYNVNPTVIRNIVEDNNISVAKRKELGIGEKDIVLIMQGSINMDRGFKEAIEAVSTIKDNPLSAEKPRVTLLIAGEGYKLAGLKEFVMEKNLSAYIKFLNRLEWSSMMEYTRMADIGLSIDSSDCLNYRYSLPNKIFEYINSGIAIIATNLPEIRSIVEHHECGILIDDNSSSNIKEAILRLLSDPVLLAQLKANSLKASKDFSWQKESEKLLDFINRSVG